MNRSLKTLLLWFLMTVLPLNAVASAIGMSCGPVHQKAMQAAPAASQSHHALDDTNEHHHDFAAEPDPGPDLVVKADHAPDSGTSVHHSTCSGCSAFCTGAVAMPSSFTAIPSFSGSETFVISPASLVTGFIPDGLLRPPRHISA